MGSRGILKRENGAFTPPRCQKDRDGRRGNGANQLWVRPEPRAVRRHPLPVSHTCSTAQRCAASTPPCPTLPALERTKAFCRQHFSSLFSKGNEARGLSADSPARWGRTVEVSRTPNRTAESSLVPISAGASLGKETQPCEQREPAVVGTHYKFKIGSVNNEHPKVTRCLFIVG